MKKEETHRVLVTGASGGIGLAIAEEFARGGHALLLVARREDRLAAEAQRLTDQYGVKADYIAADLTDPGAPSRIYAATIEQDTAAPVSILVNNAGFATYGLFHDLPPENEINLLRLNIEALVTLSRLFLPSFVARGSGGIINVASTAAFQPGPLMASYYASKAFVLSFSQALANETARTGVTISALCPGPTESDFQQRSGMQQSRLLRMGTMSAEVVARVGVRGFFRGKPVVIPGIFNKSGAFAVRLFPRKFVTTIVRTLQSPN